MTFNPFSKSAYNQGFLSFSPITISLCLISIFVFITGNSTFFEKILSYYPFSWQNNTFLVSLFMFFALGTILFTQIISFIKIEKWISILIVLITTASAYYMDTYGVIIDDIMIHNMVLTDTLEVMGLMSTEFAIRIICLGIIPSILIFKYFPKPLGYVSEIKSRLIIIAVLIVSMMLLALTSYDKYEHFWREQRLLRFYANPTYPVYSSFKYVKQRIQADKVVRPKITVADGVKSSSTKKNLYIFVVGETARADRFSLNGYSRETNPLLSKEKLISFSNVKSCATSTSESLPCMFSILEADDYKRDKALALENALDVLKKHGVKVLWRDNNSDSKGVALRVKYEDFRTPTMNPKCDAECRDIGLLSGLDEFIGENNQSDILIVLHQLGNHGPEYYRRYTSEYEKFRPVCLDGNLKNCSKQEIDNGYDNAILYTDYFLSETIQSLKKYSQAFNTGMIYVSDHGESLGENGIYLHAAPVKSAPKEQTHVPAVLWIGENSKYDISQFEKYKNTKLSHDVIFCSLLAAYDIDTKACHL